MYAKIQQPLKYRRIVLVFRLRFNLENPIRALRNGLYQLSDIVVLKILDNLFSMQNSLNANNC